ncbi:MAG: hypothetical protein R6W67_09775 [Bacteroidales bacterium]
MKKCTVFVVIILLLLNSCDTGHMGRRWLPKVPKGAEAVSVTGQPLYRTDPTPSVNERYNRALKEWKADKNNADNIIWYGRWTAYTGRYRDAIRVFSEGVRKHPSDARMLRHRGHRYISIREFSRAVTDFEKAALMMAFEPDEIEPDGMPNRFNTPVSTLKSNIFYHLGLAWYLEGELEKALDAWTSDLSLSVNDDMNVATLHWVYMTLREQGREDEAIASLEPVNSDMYIIENQAYHKLCLFYKGEITVDELTGGDYSDIMNDAMLYGLGNWYLYQMNDTVTAREYFDRIFRAGSWASFGYIAAEVKLLALEDR